LGFLRRSKGEDRELFIFCSISSLDREGGLRENTAPRQLSALACAWPSWVGPAWPTATGATAPVRQQRRSYLSSSHTSSSSSARPLPFPTDAWTRFKGPSIKQKARRCHPHYYAPLHSAVDNEKQQRGQPTRRKNSVPSYAPHALCLSTADVRTPLKTTDKNHEPATPRARHASARACTTPHAPAANERSTEKTGQAREPLSCAERHAGLDPMQQIKWTS
jgi:hypothetical protein